MVGLTLKQLSSIFLFDIAAIFVLLIFDVENNACRVVATASTTFSTLVNPENTSRLSNNIKINEVTKSAKTTIGTVGGIIDDLLIDSNRVGVDNTNLGNTVGYVVAGTFFGAALLYNWQNSDANAFLSGKLQNYFDRLVPRLFETEEVEEENRRSDDYNKKIIPRRCRKYCLNSHQKYSTFRNADRIKKR